MHPYLPYCLAVGILYFHTSTDYILSISYFYNGIIDAHIALYDSILNKSYNHQKDKTKHNKENISQEEITEEQN